MSLRFLADQCVPTSVVESLRRAGHEVLRLKDVLPVESPDPTVIQEAQRQQAILVSLNGDFADIVAYPPSQYRGIVALQVRNRPQAVPAMMEVLEEHLRAYPSQTDYSGRLLVVEPHRIRIRT